MSDEGRTPDVPVPPPAGDRPPPRASEFSWQTFIPRSPQPLFVLDQRRRLLFVNPAWEELTGVPAANALGLACTRRAPAAPGPFDAIARALCPPPDVLRGRTGRVRRLVSGLGPGRGCWDVDFFPLPDDGGRLGILGRITLAGPDTAPGHEALVEGLEALQRHARKTGPKEPGQEGIWQPEVLVALRQRAAQRYRLDQLGDSLPALRQVADQVRLVSQVRVPVLIVGELGTGKQWVARAIHGHSAAAERPFAALDCTHLPPDALASVLFGGGTHGVRIETLYLESFTRLSRDLQSRLCDRLALTEQADAGPRLIAGSAVDLEAEVRGGRLLEELRCALAIVVIRLPPLRERPDDLPRLVERLLERAGTDRERPLAGLSPEAWEIIRAHPWPGNLRQLYAALSHACTRAAGERIEAADLPVSIRRTVHLGQMPGAGPARPLPLDQLLEEAERRLIRLALERTGGHKAKAADLLEIQRPRLFRRMKALGLMDSEPSVEEPEVEIDEAGE